jgi:hypothetical protein
MLSAWLTEGRLRRRSIGGARPVAVPRSGLRLQTPAGGPRPGPPGNNDPGVEGGRRSILEGMPDNGEHRLGPEIATVERRGARRFLFAGSAGRRKYGARASVMTRTAGCSQHPGASGAPPPPHRGGDKKKRVTNRETKGEETEREREKREREDERRSDGRHFYSLAIRCSVLRAV